MELHGPFTISDQSYSKAELIDYAQEMIRAQRIENWEVDIFNFIVRFFDDKETIIQKTSGTTGDAKSVLLNKNAMITSAGMTLSYFGLKRGNTALLCLPVDYIAGKMMVVRALVGGLNLLISKPGSNPVNFLDRKIDFAAMVPMQVYESIQLPGKIRLIKKLIIGGGRLDYKLRNELKSAGGTEMYETFGMAETYTHFAVRRINGTKAEDYFRVMSGVRLETDERGCAKVFIQGVTKEFVFTNDLIEIRPDNSFEWYGRIDNVIKSGGIKVIPEILEEKIRKTIDHELVIVGIPDTKLGEKIILVIESDNQELPISEWLQFIPSFLQKHEVPKGIYTLPEFPRNQAGKVIRRKIMEHFMK